MQIIYTGRSASGRVIKVGDVTITAPKGEAVEVPDAVAESLLTTGDWQKADEPKTGRKPKEQ